MKLNQNMMSQFSFQVSTSEEPKKNYKKRKRENDDCSQSEIKQTRKRRKQSFKSSRIQQIGKTSILHLSSGQVIENIASIIKELVENALDSNCKEIKIQFFQYGTNGICVHDNGIGIKKDNLKQIGKMHSTSKIDMFDDINNIQTFGFRGEALSSICVISDLSILSRTREDNTATLFNVFAEKENEIVGNKAREIGTSVTVKNLFKNFPVRKKNFLKRHKIEFQKAISLINSYALINEKIKFNVTNITQTKNGKKKLSQIFQTQGKTIKDNLVTIFGYKLFKKLENFQFFSKEKNIKIEGYLSKISKGNGNRTKDKQFLFFKKRPIDIKLFQRIINNEYKKINLREYPMYFLNIEILKDDTIKYDVNFSADKRQILISKEKEIGEELQTFLEDRFSPNTVTLVQKTLVDFTQPILSRQKKQKEKSNLFSIKKEEKKIKNSSNSSNTQPIIPTNNYENIKIKTERSPFSSRTNISFSPKRNSSRRNTIDMWKKTEKNQKSCCSHSHSHFHSNTTPSDSSDEENDYITSSSSEEEEEIVKRNQKKEKKQKKRIQERSSLSFPQQKKSIFDLYGFDDKDDDDSDFEKFQKNSYKDTDSENEDTDGNIEEETEIEIKGENNDLVVHDGMKTKKNQKKKKKKKRKVRNISVTVNENLLKQKFMHSLQEKESNYGIQSGFKYGGNETSESELSQILGKEDFKKMEVVGQFNKGFIIGKLKNSLFILDQHASDEKYNYERLKMEKKINFQRLVFPKNLHFSASDEMIIMDHLETFEKNGFRFSIDKTKPISSRIKLTGLPSYNGVVFNEQDIYEMITLLRDNPNLFCRPSKINSIFAMTSCRSSIMVGDTLNEQQMKTVINHLGTLYQPWNCPHGRRTVNLLCVLDK